MTLLFISKYIACAIRFSGLPVAKTLHPTSFVCKPFSPHSSSSHVTTSHSLISDLLIKECGFCSSQVTRVMTVDPRLLRTKSDHTAREAIRFLRDSGLTEKQLNKIIVKNTSILTLKVDQLKVKMEFLKTLGFAPQDLAFLISVQPRLLNSSLENFLAPRILYLKNLCGPKVKLCKALKVANTLLLGDMEKHVKPKVEYVKNNMGISEGSTRFLYAVDAVMCQGFEGVEKKMRHMASLGLSQQEIYKILKNMPRVLKNSMRKTQENIDFLIHTAGLETKTLTSNPVILFLSVEKRLKPRLEVFQSLRTNPNFKGLPTLVSFFKLSEQTFCQKFGQCNTQVKSTEHAIT